MKLLSSLLSVLLLSSIAYADATTSHSSRSEGANGDYSESDDSTDSAGNTIKHENSKSTSKHWTNKGTTVTSKQVKKTEPSHGKAQTEENEEVTDTNPDGSTSREVTKKVNGNTVSEESSSATK